LHLPDPPPPLPQAFELSDASAERSAAACTIKLDKEPIIEYLQSNVVMLKWMIDQVPHPLHIPPPPAPLRWTGGCGV
jgi:hypothetical protein